MKPTPEQVAAIFGVPVENVQRQYARNADQLSAMAEKAKKTGKKVNGNTAEELWSYASEFRKKSKQK